MSAAGPKDQPLSSAQDDADSVEIEDDFYIVETNSINVSVDTSVIDSLTSSDFSLGSDTKDTEEDKGNDESSDNRDMDSRGYSDGSVIKGKSKRGNKSGPHVNPAFEDDDGFVVVNDGDNEKKDEKTVTETISERIEKELTDTKGAIELGALQKTVHITTETNEGHFNVQSATRHAPQIGHLRASENLRKERERGDAEEDACDNKGNNASRKQKTVHTSPNTDSNSSHKRVTVSEHSLYDTTSIEIPTASSSPKHVFVEHVVRVQPSSRTRRLGDHESKFSRPVSRSVSSATPRQEQHSDSSDKKSLLPVFQPVSRSQSLRVPGTSADSTDGPTKGKSRKLLRDLSFSDADAKTVMNYGALRGGQAFPRRKPPRQTDKENSGEYGEGTQIKVTPELRSHMLTLMQELLDRGKVHQVAVLEQDGSTMVESLPKWTLTHSDELGLVKAVTCTQQNMVKLPVGNEMYTFFKHGQNKMMGRSGDNVLVAEKTNAYVVVGVAVDDTPGSCLYEVSELAETLTDKGW